MRLIKSRVFQTYFVPGILFQSIVIAGGYGTGRELIEFFMGYGPLGGLLGLALVSFALWALVCALTFEVARVTESYDYNTLFSRLLGRWGWLYEACYLVMMVMVLGVAASSAGEILRQLFGLPYWVGVALLIFGIGWLVLAGKDAVEGFLSCWSFVLYGVYAVFLVLCFVNFGPSIERNVVEGAVTGAWPVGGLQYAFYNLGAIPSVLFATRACTKRRQTVGAGILAGLIGILPAVFLYLSMLGCYPDITGELLPIHHILNLLQMPALQYAFQLVLFGTLIETGTGYLFALTDRLGSARKARGQGQSRPQTALVLVATLVLSACLARFGLSTLIAKGYGAISWVFLAVYVLPLLTRGVYLIAKGPHRKSKALRVRD